MVRPKKYEEGERRINQRWPAALVEQCEAATRRSDSPSFTYWLQAAAREKLQRDGNRK